MNILEVTRLEAKIVVGVATTAFAMLLIAACGGDDVKAVPTADWSRQICDSFAELDAQADGLHEEIEAAGEDPQAVKDALIATFEAWIDLLDEFNGDIKSAGRPDLESGKVVREAFLTQNEVKKAEYESGVPALESFGLVAVANRNPAGLERLFRNWPDPPSFRKTLEAIAADEGDTQEVIDAIDADVGCAARVLGPGSEEEASTDSRSAALSSR